MTRSIATNALALLACVFSAEADIVGNVVDHTGKPLQGVTVFLVKSGVEAVTDMNGRFILPLSASGIHPGFRRAGEEPRKPAPLSYFNVLGRRLSGKGEGRPPGILFPSASSSRLVPAPLAKPAAFSDSLLAFYFGFEAAGKTLAESAVDVGEIRLQPATGIRSRLLRGEPGLAGVLAGTPLPAFSDPFVRTQAEYRLANAFRMLGYSRLVWHDFSPSPVSSAIRTFQSETGLAVTGVLDRATLANLDSAVWVREKADVIAAWQFPGFPHFMEGPVDEPAREHVAMLLAGFLAVLPADIRTNGTDVGRGWSVEEFHNLVSYGLGSNIGAFFDPVAKHEYTPQEWADRGPEKLTDYTFCPKQYYESFRNGSCEDRPPAVVGSIEPDFEFMSVVIHEYGHSVGHGNKVPDSAGTPTQADILFGRISFAQDPVIERVNDSLPHRRQDAQGEFVSQYAARNGLEEFAESFTFYVLHGRVFRERAKANPYLNRKYEFLKTWIFKGREFDTGSWPRFKAWMDKEGNLPYHTRTPEVLDSTFRWDYRYPSPN